MKRNDAPSSNLPSSEVRANLGEASHPVRRGLSDLGAHLKARQAQEQPQEGANDSLQNSQVDVAQNGQALPGASEQMVQLLLSYGANPLAILDENLRLLEASDRWFSLLGLERESAYYQPLAELMGGKQTQWRKDLELVFSGQSVKKQVELVKRGQEDYDWVQWHMQPWRRAGEFAGIVLSGEVLTQALEHEQGQEAALALGKGLLDEAQMAVLALNGNGQLRFANEGALRLLGDRIEHGDLFSSCLHPEKAGDWQYALQKSTVRWRTQGVGLDSEQVELAWHDGRMLRAWQMPWQEQGQVRGVLLFILPDAWEAQAEENEQASRAKKAKKSKKANKAQNATIAEDLSGLSLLQENIPDLFSAAMALCSADGDILWSNENWQALPLHNTRAIWPKTGAGAVAPATVGSRLEAGAQEEQHEAIEVLMIPLGEGQKRGVKHWLAVARSEFLFQGKLAQLSQLKLDKEALSQELREFQEQAKEGQKAQQSQAKKLKSEQERNVALGQALEQKQAQVTEMQEVLAEREQQYSELLQTLEHNKEALRFHEQELEETKQAFATQEKALTAQLLEFKQKSFSLNQKLEQELEGQEHLMNKVRQQRQEMDAKLHRARATAEDAQEHLMDAVAQIATLRERMDCLQVPFLVLSQEGKVQTSSAAMEKLFGLEPEQDQSFLDWLLRRAPDQKQEETLRFGWENHLWAERRGEMNALLWDRQYMVREFQLSLQLVPSSAKAGTPNYLLLFQDVGEVGQQARTLKSVKQRYEALMNQLPMGVALVSPKRGIVEANHQLARYFGCRRRSLRGVFLEDLVPAQSMAITLRNGLEHCYEPNERLELNLAMHGPRENEQVAKEFTMKIGTAMQEEGQAQLQLCLLELRAVPSDA